jgi:UDP-GlcNAc:undecaprenyl-phosphate/decaprenyl-phosphate GlcNAc-1-phosphate transferase
MLIAFVATLVLSLSASWVVRYVANEYGWLSKPRSERHIHLHPVPRFGGIGVFTSFVVVTGAAAVVKPNWLPRQGFLMLLIPATIMFAVGLWDDVKPVSARVKLGFQIASGGTLFLWMRHTAIGHTVLEWRFGSTVLLIGTITWVVLVTNSMNLVDGVDGLAGGTAALSLVAIACVASQAGQGPIVFLAIILIASTLGFLRFNLNPATMFLGDGGSLFLGFMISALGLAWSDKQTLLTTSGVAVAILALPLAETGVSIARRFISGRPLFAPDRDHLHHKLLERGLSQRSAAYLLYAVAIVSGGAGIGMAIGGYKTFAVSFSIVVVMLVGGVLTLGYAEFLEVGGILLGLVNQRRVIANDVLLRKVADRISNSSCLGTLADELEASLRSIPFDGFELSLSPWFITHVPCEHRSAIRNWGCTAKTRSLDPACWRIKIDLSSEQYGRLGSVTFARVMNRGSLLFDVNVLVRALHPAITSALERCLASQCHHKTAATQHHVVWNIEPVSDLPPVRNAGE